MDYIHERRQFDGKQELYDAMCVLHPAPEEQQTRQEMAADSDINHLINKYGQVPPPLHPMEFTATDFDMDLTMAMQSMQEARDSYHALPDAVKQLYPTWQSLAHAIAAGDANPALGDDLIKRVKELHRAELAAEAEKAAAAAASSSAAGDGASTSESASAKPGK